MNKQITDQIIDDLTEENNILKNRVRELEINLEYEKVKAYKKGHIDASIEAIGHLTPNTNK